MDYDDDEYDRDYDKDDEPEKDPLDVMLDSLARPNASAMLKEARGAMLAALIWMATNYVMLDDDDLLVAADMPELAASLVDLTQAKRILYRDHKLCVEYQQDNGQFYLCHLDCSHTGDHKSRDHIWYNRYGRS